MELINGEHVATNPTTGAKVVFRNDKWVPYTPEAASTAGPKKIGAPAPDITARMNEAAGKGAEALGGLIGPRTGRVAGAITLGVLPASNVQAGIDAAILGSSLTGVGEIAEGAKALEYAPRFIKPVARLVGRIAPAVIGGAVGGATEGHPIEGGLTGAAQGLGGEALAGITGLGRKTIQRADLNRIGGWLSQRLPIGTLKNANDFDQAFRGGQAVKKAGQSLEAAYQHINKELEGRQLEVTLGQGVAGKLEMPNKMTVPFDEANDMIRQMEDLGWSLSGDPRTAPTGKAMRAASHQMVEDVATALNEAKPGLGDLYFKRRRQFAVTSVMQKLFREPGVIDENGQVSMSKLQQLASEAGSSGYREELENLMGPEGTKSFLSSLFRGAPPLARDIEGHGIAGRAYVHGAMEPSFSLHAPKMPRHVGGVPIDLGRGRALAAGLILGPVKLASILGHYFGAPATPPTPAAQPNPSPTPGG